MKKRILVVDDDKTMLESIEMFLTERGYNVCTVLHPDAVLDCVSQNKPDLILLDVWLFGKNSKFIAKKLKTQKTTRKIPIIMISGADGLSAVAKEAKADAFLEKPFNCDDLVLLLKKFLPN